MSQLLLVWLFVVGGTAALLIALLVIRHYTFWYRRPSMLRKARAIAKSQRLPKNEEQILRILFAVDQVRLNEFFAGVKHQFFKRVIRSQIPARLRSLATGGPANTRIRAIHILGTIRDHQSIGLLRKLCLDGNQRVALAAVQALARFHDENSGRYLVGLLSHRYAINGSRVATVLEGISYDLSGVLIAALEHNDTKLQFWAATLLGRYDHSESRTALVQMLDSTNANVRAATLDSLGRIGSQQEGGAVIARLTDSVWYVRAHAALACGKMGLRDALHPLIDCLRDAIWWVRHDAGQALSQLLKMSNDDHIEKELIKHIDIDDRFAQNMIASILTNHGIVERLLRQMELAGRPGDDAKRLLFILTQAGGAPQLKHNSMWKELVQIVEGESG